MTEENHMQKKMILFDQKGYSIIKDSKHNIYKKAEGLGKGYSVIQDGNKLQKNIEFLNEVFINISGNIDSGLIKTEKRHFKSIELLDYFLRIYSDLSSTEGKKDPSVLVEKYSNVDIIPFSHILFLEIETHLSSEMEKIIMLYMNFLHLGFRMPEFYIVIDYKTNNFDFLETDIFSRDIKEIPITDNIKNKEYVDLESFQQSIYTSNTVFKIQFVVSEIDLYSKILKSNLELIPHRVFEKYKDYKEFITNENTIKINEIFIIKFRSLKDVLEINDLNFDWLIVDSRVKILSDIHYGGNALFPKRINNDYLRDRITKIKNNCKNRNLKISVYFAKEVEIEIIREVYEKNPIFDYIKFLKNGVNLLTLYANYFPSQKSTNFFQVLRSEIEILKSINYDSDSSRILIRNKREALTRTKNNIFLEKELKNQIQIEERLINFSFTDKFGIHPVMNAIVNRWLVSKKSNGEPYPRFPILVFLAVTTTFNKKIIEIKEHGERERGSDISENSRYGYEMQNYLTLMKEKGKAIFPEGGLTSDKLKSFMDHMEITPEETGLFNLNEFTSKLTEILNTYFSKMILKKKNYSNYRSEYNEQMNWWISSASGPNKLFPVIVYTSKMNKNISLFIPIENV